MPTSPSSYTNEDLLRYKQLADRLSSYDVRRDARIENNATIQQAFYAQQGQAFVAPALNNAAVLAPHATVDDYVEEPNSGPKPGFRPCYFFDLDLAATPTVDVTVSGDITLPTPGAFSYTATGVDPTQPLADFLAAVVAGLGVQTDVYFGVERSGTVLSIVARFGYTIENVVVTIA
jgi:hypothetical protein